MRILGLETATRGVSLAIIEEEEVKGEVWGELSRPQGERLLPLLEMLLAEINFDFSSLEGFAVSSGPGSFTGLRIGLATAKGFALATGKPLVGIPTLDALATGVWEGEGKIICPLLPARREEVYTALYFKKEAELERLTPYLVLSLQEVLTLLKAKKEAVIFLGEGTALYIDFFQAHLGLPFSVAPPFANFLRASQVAFLGLARLKAGERDEPLTLRPIYLRRSAAEESRGKAYGA